MTDHDLALALYLLPIVGWPSTVILIRAALRRPRIAALTERAVVAVILSTTVTIYAVLTLNTENGYPLFGSDIGRAIVRVFMIVLGLIPVLWAALYFGDRFGGRE